MDRDAAAGSQVFNPPKGAGSEETQTIFKKRNRISYGRLQRISWKDNGETK